MQLRDRQQELAIAPLWRLGFRPFFLGGALFVVLAIGLWAAALLGYLPGWQPGVAYAWLPLALVVLAAWHVGWLHNASLAYHALALGTVGGAILAMPARVLLVPFAPAAGLGLSSLLWIEAFALFVRHYAVMFCTARVDGQPG